MYKVVSRWRERAHRDEARYGFCPRSRRHSGLRFVLFRYVDSRDISLVRGNR